MSVVLPITEDTRFRLSTAVGGETSYSVPFPFQDNDDIALVRYAVDGTETAQVEGTHYTLTGAGNPAGGTATLVTPMVAGEKMLRVGRTVLARVTSIMRNGKFSSAAVDEDIDRWILIAQELTRDIGQAPRYALGASRPDEGQLLAVNANGELVGVNPQDVAFRGPWQDSPESYLTNDIVDHNGSLWRARAPNVGQEPEEGAYWTIFIPGSTTADGSVTPNKLAAEAVTTAKLAPGAVTDPKVADSFRAKIMGVAADRTALAAMDGTSYLTVNLTEAGREGFFKWDGSDLSAEVAIDTLEGIYVAPTDGSTGAWVRQFDGFNYWTKWFGAIGDYSTDNTSVIDAILAVADIKNTSVTAGRQAAAFINVEGGVKFRSTDISWLPDAGWVHTYLRYFGPSDLTPGQVSYGTNELVTLSVNSGYPNDATGGYVGEDMFNAPLHPALGVNIHKNVDNSVAVHSGPTQRIQPTDAASAKASVAYVKDENRDVFRIAYEHFASVTNFNGTLVYVDTHKTGLACTNVGVSAGWQSSSVPVAGDVVRDISTSGRYVVTSLATSVLTCDWLSGAAVPGNTLMRELAIFKGSISGTTLTVTAMFQGDGDIAVGQTIVGMFPNSGIAVSTTITALETGTGGVGTYTVNTSQTIDATEIVAGLLSVNTIQGGGVQNTDTVNIPLQFGLDGNMYIRDDVLLRTRETLADAAAAATATLTNAPVAGNPTKWITIDDNGTLMCFPVWAL